MSGIQTASIAQFRNQLLNPNVNFVPVQDQANIMKIKKNVVVAVKADSTGCGTLRTTIPMTYLDTLFGRQGNLTTLISPFMIVQHDILLRTRTMFLQRIMDPAQSPLFKNIKDMQPRYGYKMIYDIDDYSHNINEEERVPDYNFGGPSITKQVSDACIENMKLSDLITSPSKFLLQYYKNNLKIDTPTYFLPNTIQQHLWGNKRKKPIKEKLAKPKIIYPGSACHYHNDLKLKGDWESIWSEFIIKGIRDNKIDFICMGGLPWFLECVQNKIKIIPWTSTYTYHMEYMKFKPDFTIAPLVQNYFNASKSDIKFIEAAAAGAVFVGTNWNDPKLPSPYAECPINVMDNATLRDVEILFDFYCEPENYNKALEDQYKIMIRDGRYLESEVNVKRWTEIL